MPRRDTLTRRTGRPHALTDHTWQVIESALRRGQHINTACALAGVSRQSFYRWMQRADAVDYAVNTGKPYDRDELRFRDFRDTVLRARAEAAETMVDVVFEAAVGGRLIMEEPALDGSGNPIRDASGEVIMKRQWTQPDGRLALGYLKVAQPAEWAGAPQRVELSGPGGLPLDPAAAPTDDGEGEGVSQDQVGRLAARLREAVAARQAEAIEAAQYQAQPDADGVYDGEIVEED